MVVKVKKEAGNDAIPNFKYIEHVTSDRFFLRKVQCRLIYVTLNLKIIYA